MVPLARSGERLGPRSAPAGGSASNIPMIVSKRLACGMAQVRRIRGVPGGRYTSLFTLPPLHVAVLVTLPQLETSSAPKGKPAAGSLRPQTGDRRTVLARYVGAAFSRCSRGCWRRAGEDVRRSPDGDIMATMGAIQLLLPPLRHGGLRREVENMRTDAGNPSALCDTQGVHTSSRVWGSPAELVIEEQPWE